MHIRRDIHGMRENCFHETFLNCKSLNILAPRKFAAMRYVVPFLHYKQIEKLTEGLGGSAL